MRSVAGQEIVSPLIGAGIKLAFLPTSVEW
jgi:hypothetical protein